jgi:D-amino-acid dehydrogenase
VKDVIIIGGGIIGLSSAYYLLKEGYKVTVIDKGDIITGDSHINAGYSTPGHIFPLAAPGVITQALKQIWDNSSPLYIHPRLDSDFFDWAWKFRKAATKNKMEFAISVLKEIGLHSKSLYEEILETLDISYSHQKDGLLVVYQTKKMEKEEIKKAVRVKHENLEVEVLSKEQLLKLQPALSEESLGAVHYLCDLILHLIFLWKGLRVSLWKRV